MSLEAATAEIAAHADTTELVSYVRAQGPLEMPLHTEKQDTLLTWAARHGNTAAMSMLLQAGADVNGGTARRASALHVACYRGHPECVRLVLGAGAAVNKANDKGATALWLACQEGQTECVRLVLDAGAAVNKAKRRDKRATPLLIACHRGHTECVRLLLDADAAVDQEGPMFMACFRGHTECVKLLSSRGAARTFEHGHNGHQLPAANLARQYGHNELADWLDRSQRWTPLHHLEQLTVESTVEILRGGGTTLHARPGDGVPSVLERAMEANAPAAVADTIRRAAQPWSPATHHLFPEAARARAVDLLRIGNKLAFGGRFDGEEVALYDVWRGHVMAIAVTREMSKSEMLMNMWSSWHRTST